MGCEKIAHMVSVELGLEAKQSGDTNVRFIGKKMYVIVLLVGECFLFNNAEGYVNLFTQ
jgi:hypothetical protein